MPHAVGERDLQAEEDERHIRDALASDNTTLDAILNRPLDLGEKSKDAVDYEDISDDDLPDEEQARLGVDIDGDENGPTLKDSDEDPFADLTQENVGGEDLLDDLFGDQSPPPPEQSGAVTDVLQPASGNAAPSSMPNGARLSLPGALKPQPHQTTPSSPSPQPEDFPSFDSAYDDLAEEDDETREQRELFALSRKQHEGRLRGGVRVADIPPAPQTNAELFDTIWPDFEAGKPPRFGRLLPGKRAFYVAKTPLKPPKPLQPAKVSLELCPDQERSFKLAGPAATNASVRQQESAQKGLVVITDADAGAQASDDGVELEEVDEDEIVGGATWNDLALLCEDWDVDSLEAPSDHETLANGVDRHLTSEDEDDLWMDAADRRPAKKRKTNVSGHAVQLPVFQQDIPSLDDPEDTTRKLSKRAVLDLNDPNMLVDERRPDSLEKKARKPAEDFRRDVSGSLTKKLARRYNLSNDEAYDQLKENHQHKVRSTLGNLSIEHSLPAIKLQYPFYKVKLSAREARSFHRPVMNFLPNQAVSFSKLRHTKRKTLKGKETSEIFATSDDLTLGDNSNMTLLEYSEEYPTMLSNFGMGSKLINYYRRKDAEDTSRPKLDIGETHVLLPQDKSPFSIFGNIDPGQIVPTLHNAMYRAPVYKHQPKSTDFLVGRSTTGVKGHQWYLRNMENLFVVGQELPSVEVPGMHSRKVTEAAKRRLRMISYRVYTKSARPHSKGPPLNHEMILKHLPGSEVSQNRGKMREFMQFNRDTQSYEPRPNDVVPDETTMRTWVKPEDLCQLEATQVGERHLLDAGYNKDERDAEEEDEERTGESMEQQLAPWNTTKNFLNACQGKAMLQLHGDGDPSGRGEAFSFVKTSMKGGFRAIGESVEDKLDQKRQKELNGHSYNVAKQQRAYDEAIRKIWDAQSRSLSSTIEHSDIEMDVDEEPADSSTNRGRTPRSEYGTPAAFATRDDETTSQLSRFSTGSQSGKVLRITRNAIDKFGKPEQTEEVVRDPKVIREYLKRRRAQELSRMTLWELKPTGDAEYDSRQQKRLEEELARLHRNKERRHVREKAKGIFDPDAESPTAATSPAAVSRAAGTQRRCANCGQVGHIKTNKKLCPMLNGKMKQDDGFDDSAFGSPSVGPSSQMAPPGPPTATGASTSP